MSELFDFEFSILETIVRGSVFYLAVVLIIRVIPKRETGSISPNDMIGLIIVGNLAGQAIAGEAMAGPDLLLLIAVVLAWSHVFNLLEYYFPRLRGVAQDTPTLLVYDGKIHSRQPASRETDRARTQRQHQEERGCRHLHGETGSARGRRPHKRRAEGPRVTEERRHAPGIRREKLVPRPGREHNRTLSFLRFIPC